MAETPVKFMEIFGSVHTIPLEGKEKQVSLKKIVIPIIQRDYAQGRRGVKRVRDRFLSSLKDALLGTPIILDFIYGDINSKGEMTPLDGQQRLTTLFLLHYYAAKKEHVSAEEYAFLSNFSYETRYSAREFCQRLISFDPSFSKPLSEEIEDQSWFPLDWKKDATVSGMLRMLDSMQEVFSDVDDIWGKLKNGAIRFYFDTLNDLGLTDEIYIKMNSRGKPLSTFEHFKAELERNLREIDKDTAKRIISKIDREWTDMLWAYRGKDNVIDDEFLRYFRFIVDIICYKQGGTTQGQPLDEFDIISKYFSRDSEGVEQNLKILEDYFDCWQKLSMQTPISSFLSGFLTKEHQEGTVMSDGDTDIFGDCLRTYSDVHGNGRRPFTLARIIILYSFVVFLTNPGSVSGDDFRRRLRIVNNLVRNSGDEISDSESRSAGNRMPNILKQVDSIILTGKIDTDFTKENKNFNEYQMQEEIEKEAWLKDHMYLENSLYYLEDHPFLEGQIAVVGLENPDHFGKFMDLFSCSLDNIDRALTACGDYKQLERGDWRYQVGSAKINKAWISLFHKGANKGFDGTKKVLSDLLDSMDEINDDSLKAYYEGYLKDCEDRSEYDWRYYYIKYPAFRPGRYGKCSWTHMEKGYYDMHVLYTEYNWSENSYQPFLYEAAPEMISREDLGEYLTIGDYLLACENEALVLYQKDRETEVERYPIPQNEAGLDTKDRIPLIKSYLESLKKRYIAASV